MHPETVAEAMGQFYETRADFGHAFVALYRECVRLSGLPPAMAFFLTTHLFEQEFLYYCHRLAGSARPRPYADRHTIRFPELN